MPIFQFMPSNPAFHLYSIHSNMSCQQSHEINFYALVLLINIPMLMLNSHTHHHSHIPHYLLFYDS